MKEYIKKVLLFGLILLLSLSVPIFVLYKGGELKPYNSYLVKLDDNQLFGLAYSYYDRQYKLSMANFLKPDVLVLGSSRIMQVNQNMISDDYTFYNAGGGVQSVVQFKQFLDQLEYNPQLMIVDLNEHYFNSKASKLDPNDTEKRQNNSGGYEAPHFDVDHLTTMIVNCSKDVLKGKIDFGKLLQDNHNIGLNAIMNNNGFKDDGQYHYGAKHNGYSEEGPHHFPNAIRSIASNSSVYVWGEGIDPAVLPQVEVFIKEASKRNIKVVAILPPFAPSVYQAMKESSKYGYIEQICPALSIKFKKYNAEIFDYSDVDSLGCVDDDFYDHFHGREEVYGSILRDIKGKVPNDISIFFK